MRECSNFSTVNSVNENDNFDPVAQWRPSAQINSDVSMSALAGMQIIYKKSIVVIDAVVSHGTAIVLSKHEPREETTETVLAGIRECIVFRQGGYRYCDGLRPGEVNAAR